MRERSPAAGNGALLHRDPVPLVVEGRYHSDMAQVGIGERRAALSEVEPHRAQLRRAALACGLAEPRLRDDGTIIVHSDEPGYRAVVRFATQAARFVGTYVHVITDNVPAAQVDATPL